MDHREADAPRPHPGHRRRFAALALLVIAGLLVLGASRLDLAGVGRALGSARPGWIALGAVVMAASYLSRAESWYALVRAALPGAPVTRILVRRGLLVGLVGSAVTPARLGEAARVWVVSRRLGAPWDTVSVIAGTLLSQTLLNLLSLLLLTLVALTGFAGPLQGGALFATIALPAAVLLVLLGAPRLLAAMSRRSGRIARALSGGLRQLVLARRGLRGFRGLRAGAHSVGMQVLSWGLQLAVCVLLLRGLDLTPRASVAAAATALVAVNITAIVPLTPANVGVFQAACIAALAPYGIGSGRGLAYGLVLQAVDVGVAFALGIPALAHEGLSWSDIHRPGARLTPHGAA